MSCDVQWQSLLSKEKGGEMVVMRERVTACKFLLVFPSYAIYISTQYCFYPCHSDPSLPFLMYTKSTKKFGRRHRSFW